MLEHSDHFPTTLESLNGLSSEDAITKLIEQISLHPTDARLFLLLGAENAAFGNTDAAEGAFICALNRAPNFSIARFQLGLLQFSNQRVASAFATWEVLDALAENDPLRVFKAAIEAYSMRDYSLALGLFAKGIDLNTSNIPLNKDMQQFVDEIQNLLTESRDKDEVDEEKAEQETTAHFFMSAYRTH